MNGVQLQGVDLHGRELRGVDLGAVRHDDRETQGSSLDGWDIHGVDLRGAELVGVDAHGNPVELSEAIGLLVPAQTDEGDVVELVITAAEPDTERGDLTYYALELDGQNICGPEGRGLFVAGRWDETGARIDDPSDPFATTFSCTTGVIAKCVAWGYTPYGVGPEAHQTCTRLARADYCGDGVSYTRDGTEIDMFDELGVMRPDESVDMDFEAGWGPDGAVCVNGPRYTMLLPDGEELLPPCWESLPRCETETDARTHDATLVNRSHGDVRHVCAP